MAERRPVKTGANFVLYSDGCIRVMNVRLSYPHLAEKYSGKDGKGTPRYSAVFHLPKKTHLAAKDAVKAEMEKCMAENKLKALPPDKKFLRNGVEGAESEGCWTINAAESKRRPTCKDRNKQNVEREDIEEMFFGGCTVNALIRPWPQNNDYGKRVNANLIAVQFVKDDGTRFGGEGYISEDAVDDSFDDIDDDSDGGFDADDDDDL